MIYTLGADNPLDHVVNHPWYVINGWWVWSAHIGNLALSALIMLLVFPIWARRLKGDGASGNERYLPGGKGSNLFEVFCVYLRDVVVRPVLGANTQKFMPLLWTFFWFILINNLLGLVPIVELLGVAFGFLSPDVLESHRSPFGGTATGNIWVTGTLAIIAGSVYILNGFRSLGVGGFLHHMTGGAPKFVWPIIVPIELIGTFLIKTGALAIRLWANMTAGHLLVATLFMFVTMSLRGLPIWGAAPISIISVVGAIGVYILEIFVALLQAFIFMFLTTIFIGQLSAHDHEHAHAGH